MAAPSSGRSPHSAPAPRRPTALIWGGEGGFAGEDLHRLAHRRLGPLLEARLGADAPAVIHRRGPIGEAARAAAELEADLLVLPAFRAQLWDSLALVEQLEPAAPELTLALSGWGADPELIDASGRVLRHRRLLIARGEPEAALTDALALLLGPAPPSSFPHQRLTELGLALPDGGGGWLSRGRFRQLERLDQLPSVYASGTHDPAELDGTALIEVARGCRNRCAFCLSCNFDPRGVRPVPTPAILAEIDHAAARGAHAFALLCSALNDDVEVLEAIADALAPRGAKVESTLHAARLDQRRLAAIGRLRWRRMIIGLQSLTPRARELMGRQVDPSRFRAAIEALSAVAEPTVEIILGLPGDTLRGFLRTLRFCLELPAHIEIYWLRLDPGSEFLRRRRELGLVADFARQGQVTSTPTFSADDLARAAETTRRLARRPWRWRARSLGLDFHRLYPHE